MKKTKKLLIILAIFLIVLASVMIVGYLSFKNQCISAIEKHLQIDLPQDMELNDFEFEKKTIEADQIITLKANAVINDNQYNNIKDQLNGNKIEWNNPEFMDQWNTPGLQRELKALSWDNREPEVFYVPTHVPNVTTWGTKLILFFYNEKGQRVMYTYIWEEALE